MTSLPPPESDEPLAIPTQVLNAFPNSVSCSHAEVNGEKTLIITFKTGCNEVKELAATLQCLGITFEGTSEKQLIITEASIPIFLVWLAKASKTLIRKNEAPSIRL